MKKLSLFLAAVGVISMSSCINSDENLYEGGQDDLEAKEIVDKFVMTEKFDVPVQAGSNTVVMQGEDTLYYGNIPMQIDVPKFSVSAATRATNDLKWYFTPTDQVSGWSSSTTRSGILLFEDLDNGDSDYNDFVCAIKEVIQYTESGWSGAGNYAVSFSNVKIKPLALGNTLPLKFGVEFRRKDNSALLKDIELAGDVRDKYFSKRTGFINTTNEIAPVTSGSLSEVSRSTGDQLGYINPNNLCVLWYIESKGVKRYVADAGSKFLDQKILGTTMITQNKVPFGLFVPIASMESSWATTFRWPLETKSIFSAYPDFNKWLKGEVDTPFGNPNNALLFDTSKLSL